MVEKSALIVTGNPNVGKSVVFHLLTGRYATVSNYPGTTVMVSHGTASIGGRTVHVADTPGLNSLLAASEDEMVARSLLLEDHKPEGGGEAPFSRSHATVLQVGDAKNLPRTLALTLELAEAGVPLVLDLNMMDEARQRRVHIDLAQLAAALGAPVVSTVATQRWGLEGLRRAIPQAKPPSLRMQYPAVIEETLAQMERLLPEGLPARRALGVLWLSGDRAAMEEISRRLDPESAATLARLAAQVQADVSTPLGLLISRARLRQAHRLARAVTTTATAAPRPWLERLGAWAMHPVWGLPILAGVLGGMYLLVGDLAAQRGVDFFEEVVFGRFVTPAFTWAVPRVVSSAWWQALLIGPYGLLTMALPYAFAIILPIVTMFFLCFGFIEDVGYLPRLAVMANRFCRLLGLNGKAVLPLVLGLGCDTMATMTARILDTRRDRILVTLLLALGIPCSAQLGVILAMLAGRPPLALGVWLGVLVAVMVVVGQIAARLLPGEESPFLYEIPPLRAPQLSNVLTKTLGRLEWYVKEAVPLFFAGTLALFILDAAGALGLLERLASPLVVSWLGLPAKATEAFLIGFLRRDFGAAGLFALQRAGALTGVQIVVSLVTITLFVPCIAQYFMMIKERGWKMATGMAALVFGLAFLVGGALFRALAALRIPL